MNHLRGCDSEPVHLGRQGHRYGPYSWDDISRFAEQGTLLPEDLLWSPSLSVWVRASDIDGLEIPMPAARSSSPGRPALIAGIVYFALVAIAASVALVFTLWPFGVEVEDYYPKEGAAGSYVVIALDSEVELADLEISYRETPLAFRGLTSKHVGVHIPVGQASGDLKVSWKGREAASLPFAVLEPTVSLLHREELQPSRRPQTVVTPAGVSIRIPGGLLEDVSTLTVSKVEHAAALRPDPFAEPDVYDISIEGLEQLDDFVEIGIPYDPTQLDSSLPAHPQFSPARWDEERETWVDLHYRVDESTNTLYVVSDHLTLFWHFLTGAPTAVGFAKTMAIVALVGIPLAEVVERWANDKYLSPDWKIRVLYSEKALRATFPDSRWEKAMSDARLRIVGGYDPTYSSAVQDIAHIFEESLKCYIAAGFPDPTQVTVGGVEIYTSYIKVKVDSLYNYYWQGGEMAHESFWDTIHIPTEIIRLEFFDRVENSQGSFEQSFNFVKSTLAHELFHSFQYPYYGRSIAFFNNQHTWWREVCAEWAANDLARIPYRPGWDQDSPVLIGRIGHGFMRQPINSRGKLDDTTTLVGGLDYEYLAAIFVRYLVREMGLDFRGMVEYVASKDSDTDALVFVREFIRARSAKDLHRVYLDFAVWLLEKSQLPLSDFANPGNTKVVATRSDTVRIAEEKATLMLTTFSQSGGERVLVFTGREGAETLKDGKAPALVFTETGTNNHQLEVVDGDILYFVCANGHPQDRITVLTIEQKKGDPASASSASQPWEKVAQYSMDLKGNGTADVWAVRISTGNLRIEPARVEDAMGYREYPFKASVGGLAKEIREVTLEFDFGDGRKDAKGSKTLVVEEGKGETELRYRYEPSPAVTAEDAPITRTLLVQAVHDGETIDRAEATVTVKQAELSIQPPRTIVLELAEGVTEASERFVALAQPEGTYRYEWKFGDGGGFSDPDRIDGRSEASHVFTGLKVGDSFQPTVMLYSADGKLLAQDRITVTVDEVGARARFVLVDRKVVSVRKPLWVNFGTKDVPDDGPWSIGSESASSSMDYEERERWSGPYQDRSEWIRTFSARFKYSWGPFPREFRAREKIRITLSVDDAGTAVRYSKGSHEVKLDKGSMFVDEQRASIMLLAGEGKDYQVGVASAYAQYEIGKGTQGPGHSAHEFVSNPDWTYDEGDTYLFHVAMEQNLIRTTITYTYRFTTH